MTKYQELCDIFTESRYAYFDNRLPCLRFASALVIKLENYLQCLGERIKIFPLDGERRPNTVHTIAGEMKLVEDGYWQLRIGIELHQKNDIMPNDSVTIPIFIKKTNNFYIANLGEERKKYKIHIDKDYEFNAFFEDIFNVVKKVYEQDINQFHEREDSVRRIGFLAN